MNFFRLKRRAKQRGFSAAEIMVTVAIAGVMAAMILPAIVNTKRMTKRRIDYIQYRDYLRAVSVSFQETLHLERPLLVSLDFTSTELNFDHCKDYLGEMFYSSMMNGFAYPEMRYLNELNFSDTAYNDEWTQYIVPAPALAHLHLDRTEITDATLAQLSGDAKEDFIYGRAHPMSKLKTLSLVQCPNITKEGIQAVRDAIPGCHIILSQGERDDYDEEKLFEEQHMSGMSDTDGNDDNGDGGFSPGTMTDGSAAQP